MQMAPSAFHYRVRRGVKLPNPVISAIVVGFVVFNLILLMSWCMVKRRRAKMKKKLIQAAYVNANPWLAQLNGYNPWNASTKKSRRHGSIPLTSPKKQPSLAHSQGSMTKLFDSLQQSHHLTFPEPFYITTSNGGESRPSSILRLSPTPCLSPLSASFINVSTFNAHTVETDSHLDYEPTSPSNQVDNRRLSYPSQPYIGRNLVRGLTACSHYPSRPTSDPTSFASVALFSNLTEPLVASQTLVALSSRDSIPLTSMGNSQQPDTPSHYLPLPPPRAAAPFPLIPRRRVSSAFIPTSVQTGFPRSTGRLRSGGPYRSSMGDF